MAGLERLGIDMSKLMMVGKWLRRKFVKPNETQESYQDGLLQGLSRNLLACIGPVKGRHPLHKDINTAILFYRNQAAVYNNIKRLKAYYTGIADGLEMHHGLIVYNYEFGFGRVIGCDEKAFQVHFHQRIRAYSVDQLHFNYTGKTSLLVTSRVYFLMLWGCVK